MKVEDQLALILTMLDEQSQGIADSNRKISDVQASISELTAAKADFELEEMPVLGTPSSPASIPAHIPDSDEDQERGSSGVTALTKPPVSIDNHLDILFDADGKEVDRLSRLPDSLLRDIISRLPPKDAARTAVLSHRWNPIWRAASRLVDPAVLHHNRLHVLHEVVLSKNGLVGTADQERLAYWSTISSNGKATTAFPAPLTPSSPSATALGTDTEVFFAFPENAMATHVRCSTLGLYWVVTITSTSKLLECAIITKHLLASSPISIDHRQGNKIPKPPWLLSTVVSRSWCGRMQLISGFLLEVSPWCSDYTMWVQWQQSMTPTDHVLKLLCGVSWEFEPWPPPTQRKVPSSGMLLHPAPWPLFNQDYARVQTTAVISLPIVEVLELKPPCIPCEQKWKMLQQCVSCVLGCAISRCMVSFPLRVISWDYLEHRFELLAGAIQLNVCNRRKAISCSESDHNFLAFDVDMLIILECSMSHCQNWLFTEVLAAVKSLLWNEEIYLIRCFWSKHKISFPDLTASLVWVLLLNLANTPAENTELSPVQLLGVMPNYILNLAGDSFAYVRALGGTEAVYALKMVMLMGQSLVSRMNSEVMVPTAFVIECQLQFTNPKALACDVPQWIIMKHWLLSLEEEIAEKGITLRPTPWPCYCRHRAASQFLSPWVSTEGSCTIVDLDMLGTSKCLMQHYVRYSSEINAIAVLSLVLFEFAVDEGKLHWFQFLASAAQIDQGNRRGVAVLFLSIFCQIWILPEILAADTSMLWPEDFHLVTNSWMKHQLHSGYALLLEDKYAQLVLKKGNTAHLLQYAICYMVLSCWMASESIKSGRSLAQDHPWILTIHMSAYQLLMLVWLLSHYNEKVELNSVACSEDSVKATWSVLNNFMAWDWIMAELAWNCWEFRFAVLPTGFLVRPLTDYPDRLNNTAGFQECNWCSFPQPTNQFIASIIVVLETPWDPGASDLLGWLDY